MREKGVLVVWNVRFKRDLAVPCSIAREVNLRLSLSLSSVSEPRV